MLYVSEMRDCCTDKCFVTNGSPDNSYTKKSELACHPKGTRIDHVFVRHDTKNLFPYVDEYKLPLDKLVPGERFSYSDHEAVFVKLRLAAIAYGKKECLENVVNMTERIAVLKEAVALCEASQRQLNCSRIFYYTLAVILTLVIILLIEFTAPTGFKTIFMLSKFVLFGLLLFAVFMASIWNFMERNGILAEQKAMEIMLRSLENGLS